MRRTLQARGVLDPMNKYKLRLIGILLIQLVITVIHNTNVGSVDVTDLFQLGNVTYLLGMGWGLFAFVYAIKLGCPQCGARQVFRSLSIFSVRWPQEHCHKCGAKIE
jgi:hypothetical protein